MSVPKTQFGTSPHEDHAWVRGYTILYVDDEPDNLLVFQATFGQEFTVRVASSGAEALHTIGTEKIHLVVTDHRMPQMTGVDLCEQIRRLYPDTRCLLMTAYADMNAVVDATNRGGVHAYVLKPWDADNLRQLFIENLQNAHLKHMVSDLNGAIAEKEGRLNTAIARAKALHDVVNTTLRFTSAYDSMLELVRKNKDAIPPAVFREFETELTRLQEAISHVHHVQKQHRAPTSTKLHPEYVSVNQLLAVVRGLVDPLLTGVANLVFNCSPNARAWVDRTSISRILINLIKNARESIDHAHVRHGLILIDVYSREDNIVFTISDNGPGIAGNIRNEIFKDLFSTKESQGGTGVGLAVARTLAEENNGTLELIDSSDMPGATFRLTLPAQAPDVEATPTASASSPSAHKAGAVPRTAAS